MNGEENSSTSAVAPEHEAFEPGWGGDAIRKVTLWETPDGKRFIDEQAAKAHLEMVSLETAYKGREIQVRTGKKEISFQDLFRWVGANEELVADMVDVIRGYSLGE